MLIPIVFLTCFSLARSSNSGGGGGGSSDLFELPVGLIVSDWNQNGGVVTAINIALAQQHRNQTPVQFKLWADRIKTVDAYKLSKIVCRQFERGIFALMGAVDPESFDTLHSYANAFEMPFVTPWFPETAFGLEGYGAGGGGEGDRPRPGGSPASEAEAKSSEFAIQIRPDYHKALVDIVTYYGWDKIIYVYSDFDGLLRLQAIYKSIPRDERGFYRFQVEMVRKVRYAKIPNREPIPRTTKSMYMLLLRTGQLCEGGHPVSPGAGEHQPQLTQEGSPGLLRQDRKGKERCGSPTTSKKLKKSVFRSSW